MISPRFSLASLFLLAALSPAVAATKAKPTRPEVGTASDGAYKGAIVMDAATGTILLEDHADIVSPPASMTKLMTFAVLHDKLAKGSLTLQTPVTVTKADAKVAMLADSTAVWLKEKEVFPVEELIYAMMIQSANDAAYALAEFSGGSVEAFVEQMNAKAHELGMTHSTFRTPHGLTTSRKAVTEGDLTSPRDYALLCRYLILQTDILKYTSIKERPFGGSQRKDQVAMTSHNHLLGHFDGLDGLKTGYTGGASYCLSATAQRNGHRVIVVVMGSPTAQKRDLKVTELLNRGFELIPAGSPAFTAAPHQILDDSSSPLTPAPAPSPATAAKPAATTDAPADGGPAIKFPVLPKKK